MDLLEPYQRQLSKDEINDLPLRRYEGEVRLINTEDKVPEAVEHLSREPLLGFDTETRPSFKKGVEYPPALLQLAGEHQVYLFQINRIPFSSGLAGLLADDRIIKTGVAVSDDILGLQKITPFEPAKFLDLGDLSRKLNLSTNGLRTLAANLLGFRISKRAQRSDWGQNKLSRRQIIYAATDAWVGRELYLRLQILGAL